MKPKLKIKEVLTNGIVRLQSQLHIGKDTCDYILEDDVLKLYNKVNGNFDFQTIVDVNDFDIIK